MEKQMNVRPAMWVTIGGQVVAALGTVLQWLAAPELVTTLPSGLGYIIGALVILWLDRRAAWSPLAAIALTAWIFAGSGEMLFRQLASPNTLMAAGYWGMVTGLVISSVAATVALVRRRLTPTPMPLSSRNPLRHLVVVALVALVAVEIGVGAQQDFDLSRPGPSLFLLLPVLVALVPGRSMLLLSAVMSAVFLEGSFSNARLADRLTAPDDTLTVVFAALSLAGMVTAVAVGAMAVLHGRTRAAVRG
jgi:hypothetical protein